MLQSAHLNLSADHGSDHRLDLIEEFIEFVSLAGESPEFYELQAEVLFGESGFSHLTDLVASQKGNMQ